MRQHLLTFLGIVVLTAVVAAPALIHYRQRYDYAKRLRVVTPGKVYRSGQLSEAGFREAVARLRLRTIINLQDEAPEPVFDTGRRESDVCTELGIRYVFLKPDLIPRNRLATQRPEAVDQFLQLMDQPETYPVLLHCRAGLHRTGTLAALYRIEYEGWSVLAAIKEMQAHGFGLTASTARNDYLKQYLLEHTPRRRDFGAVSATD